MSTQAQPGTRIVEVGGAQPYRIAIGAGLLGDGAALAQHVRGRHVLLVSDSNVAPLYAAQVREALHAARAELRVGTFVLPAGEASKTLANFGAAIDALATLGASRDGCVFALGGGVVGDLAGFAAACWMRGVDCVQLPTTLLSMVDSSVGGKTAVDIEQGKNLVGAFHPPRAVFADTATLRTLPPRELRAGLAEVIKYGAIRDPRFFQWLETEREALLAGDADTLGLAIAASCEHKAEIVERDPLEHGERALLNFGHTFGHAIETEQGYAGPGSDNLNHGEAVAVGMVPGRTPVGAAGPGRRSRCAAPATRCCGRTVCLPASRTDSRRRRCSRGCVWTRRPRPDACAWCCGDRPGRWREVVPELAEDAVLRVLSG